MFPIPAHQRRFWLSLSRLFPSPAFQGESYLPRPVFELFFCDGELGRTGKEDHNAEFAGKGQLLRRRKKKFTKAKKLVGFLFHLDRDYINSSEDFVYQKMSVLLDILIEASLGFGQGWRNLEREGGHVCHSI